MPEAVSTPDNSCSSSETSSLKCHLVLTTEQKDWFLASILCDQLKMTGLLSKNPQLAEWKNYLDGNTALHYAAKFGDCAIIRLLAGNHKVDVNVQNNAGLTPLHIAAAHAHSDAIILLTSVYDADTCRRDSSGRLPSAYLPNTKQGQVLKRYFKNPLSVLLENRKNYVYMLIEKRSTPVDGETEGSGLTSPVFTMRNLSDIGLSDAEMMHTNVPINTQFPWQNTDVNREQSPARRPRDTSLTRTGHLLSCAPESVSRESSQDRQISKRRRALEQVASMSIRGARRSTEMLGSSALIYPITRRRHTVRAGDSTRGNLADAIYATVRRRRQLTGPTENPLGQNRSARSPGSARAAGRRREILSINDGLTPKPQSEQNSVSDSAPDDSSPPTPTNVSVSSS